MPKIKRFTPKEDKFIKENYLKLSIPKLSKKLNRAVGSVYGRIKLLGLSIPREIIKQRCKEAAKAQKYNKGRFKKGHKTWNAGTKGLTKRNKTTFKKGQKSWNIKPVGTISIRKDKRSGLAYKYIKIADNKWKLFHREIYRQHFGTIPPRTKITFRDGNSMNCTISNLEAISNNEAMNRNTIHRYPPELKTAIKRINKLNNQIKNYEQAN